MVTETTSEIESIDVANDDLIAILASLADGNNERLAVVGDGPNKMIMRTATTNVVEDTVIYASDLIEDGEVVDTVEANAVDNAELQVL